MSILVAFLLLWGEASRAWVSWGRMAGRGRNGGLKGMTSPQVSL